ncbi:DUF397 domain-containing protein [Nocardia sp. NPDC088792]|uniref:DUF397 domain-containing protein n=1 Tax=Nocardia sp. NPDC088792 TaxID=3364332 RepID=UPI00380D658A
MAPFAGRAWRKSTYSGSNGGQCVEMSFGPERVLIRDSKYSGPALGRPIVSVSNAQWPRFLDLVLSGAVGDLGQGVRVELCSNGGVILADQSQARLLFTVAEWDAFAKGIADGQFVLPPSGSANIGGTTSGGVSANE